MDKVMIVTGGGRGVGRAIASALADAGFAVAVVARSEPELAETRDALTARGGRALALPCDVRDAAAVAEAVAAVTDGLGPVTALVNNAGTGLALGPLWEIDPEEWWTDIHTSLGGAFNACRAVLPGMIARGRGRIINVASGAGASPVPYLGAYVASKAALIRLTENLALENREHGISVFAIHPGTVRTAMVTEGIDTPAGRQWFPWFRGAVEQGQYVMPERAAQLVLQLASGRGDALTGRFLTIHQDLDALLARAEEIAAADLYTLRVRESG